MGIPIVTMIIDLLRLGGVQADEAYPGGRIPALTGPMAAVRLGRIDRGVRSTALLVTVMSPADQGGAVCETTALQAIQVLEEARAACQKEVCKFDHVADVFYIEITAVFSGVAEADQWTAGPGFSVTIGLQAISWATGFSISRQTADGGQWSFTLEELLGPGSIDPPEPLEPFTLTVTRAMGEEVFTECVFTSVEREDTIRGIRQIRKGTAASRAITGIV